VPRHEPIAPRARPVDATEAGLREPTPADLARLQALAGYPMVSVLLPTGTGAQLGPVEQAQARQLIDQATRRLAAELPHTKIEDLAESLDRLLDRIADTPTGLGLALFAGVGIVEAYRLSLSPTPRVVIDPTFATRDLARAVAENPPYRLLCLASASAHLYLGAGAQLHELGAGGFPLGEPALDHPPDRRGHLHQGEPTHRSPRRGDRFLRRVDDTLTAEARTQGLPLIVAGAEPVASRFRRRTRHQIVGTIPGNHERTPTARLAELARPVIDLHLARQRQDALDRLERAVDQRRAAFGINEIWRAAHDGRIALLLVDPSYTYPALVAPTGRSLTRSIDPEHPDVLDDAVDDIIELVAPRGGQVCFTTLNGTGDQIAAVLDSR
jgi:hypothetical protein